MTSEGAVHGRHAAPKGAGRRDDSLNRGHFHMARSGHCFAGKPIRLSVLATSKTEAVAFQYVHNRAASEAKATNDALVHQSPKYLPSSKR